jgi:hypothetical protein
MLPPSWIHICIYIYHDKTIVGLSKMGSSPSTIGFYLVKLGERLAKLFSFDYVFFFRDLNERYTT